MFTNKKFWSFLVATALVLVLLAAFGAVAFAAPPVVPSVPTQKVPAVGPQQYQICGPAIVWTHWEGVQRMLPKGKCQRLWPWQSYTLLEGGVLKTWVCYYWNWPVSYQKTCYWAIVKKGQ